MATDLTAKATRGPRLRQLIAILGAMTAAVVNQSGMAGDPPGSSPSGSSVHFYSTAEPPATYPGPSPEAASATTDPLAVSDASTPAEPPTPEPSPGPTAPASSTPLSDPPVVRAGVASTEEEPDAEPEPVPVPPTDPMRVASATPVDRVPATDLAEPAPSAEADPITVAKAALAACKVRHDSVRDYTCTFIKRERIDGRLSGYEVMAMKARTDPRSIYFKFRQPNAGREAIYVHGWNGGKAIVHDVGFGRLVAGSLNLDPRSRRAMDGNRHPITEAGIGFMIETLLEGWHREMNPRDSVVTIREGVLVNKRPCMMIICNHPRRERHFVFHEVRLYIDRELGLPIRFEAYDWPRRPGEAAPLLEEYTYTDLRLDVGLSDHDFDPSNKTYSFGRF